jgi:DNA-binding XRE family transcriptional regulator
MPSTRKTHRNPELVRQMRDRFAEDIQAGRLDLGEAVKRMRKISGLTQAEFARHRGLSLLTLKRIEAGKGNPTVETLDRIGSIFGLRVGFVRPSKDQSPAGPG